MGPDQVRSPNAANRINSGKPPPAPRPTMGQYQQGRGRNGGRRGIGSSGRNLGRGESMSCAERTNGEVSSSTRPR